MTGEVLTEVAALHAVASRLLRCREYEIRVNDPKVLEEYFEETEEGVWESEAPEPGTVVTVRFRG